METSGKDLFAPVRDLATGDALESWRWLVGRTCRPLLLTAMGDLFILRPASLFRREAVLFLDTMTGACERVAANYGELRERLASDGAERWLLPSLVAELRDRGAVLQPGECYSPKHPPALGGAVEASNFEPTDWRVHLGLAGQVHEQLEGVPRGSKVRFEVVE